MLLNKDSVLSYSKWAFICLVIGILSGSTSALFLQTLEFVTDTRNRYNWLIFLLPVAGFLIGWMYDRYGKAVQNGNQQLFKNIHQPGEVISPRMAPLIYIGTLATHLFGGSAGREGTALQLSGSLSDQLSHPFSLSATDRRTLLITAVAAGFGSVFGTPLAGIVFSIEVIRFKNNAWKALLPAFVATCIADFICSAWGTTHTPYAIHHLPHISFSSIGATAFAGIAFGLCAWLFVFGMKQFKQLFNNYISYPPLRPFAGGVLVIFCFMSFPVTDYLGLGIPMIQDSFHDSVPAYGFALKLLLTVITLSSGFKGGEVTPLFFIGATLGNALALFLPLPLDLLAGMGFVAVFAGATNTPVACTILALELFGTECALFVAISCGVAYLASGKTTIYTEI